MRGVRGRRVSAVRDRGAGRTEARNMRVGPGFCASAAARDGDHIEHPAADHDAMITMMTTMSKGPPMLGGPLSGVRHLPRRLLSRHEQSRAR